MTIAMTIELHEDKLDGVVTVHTCCGASVQSDDLKYALRLALEVVKTAHAAKDAELEAMAVVAKAAGPLH